MLIDKITFDGFRNLEPAEVEFPRSGITLVTGNNGQGKSNLLEAIGLLGNSSSFRRASVDSMIRVGRDSAVVRGSAVNSDRELLIEMEISLGKSRTFVNKQRKARARRLDESVPVTSFSPVDLEFVKGSPSLRRGLLDDLLSSVSERFRAVESDFLKALKQRNSLLKQCRGRLGSEAELTLDVWDERLSEAGDQLATSRHDLIEELSPMIERIYGRIGGMTNASLVMKMASRWAFSSGGPGLASALRSSRAEDLRREVTTVGPHRDDVDIALGAMPARTHASQGEQRSIAVATKLAAHEYCRSKWAGTPVLLLDDVFSELDDQRVERFLGELPQGQVFIASAAGHAPVEAELELRVESGKILG